MADSLGNQMKTMLLTVPAPKTIRCKPVKSEGLLHFWYSVVWSDWHMPFASVSQLHHVDQRTSS